MSSKKTQTKPKGEATEKAPQKPEPVDNPVNTAIIMRGKHEVRRYTLDQHGEAFVDLAKQYLSHPERGDYTMELKEIGSRIACPKCGHKFHAI